MANPEWDNYDTRSYDKEKFDRDKCRQQIGSATVCMVAGSRIVKVVGGTYGLLDSFQPGDQVIIEVRQRSDTANPETDAESFFVIPKSLES